MSFFKEHKTSNKIRLKTIQSYILISEKEELKRGCLRFWL